MKNRHIPAFLWVLFVLPSLASASEVAYPKLSFQEIKSKQARTAGKFRGVVKDKDGYLWIGTWGKLLRYNGYEFEEFHKGRYLSGKNLVDEAISSLAYSDTNGLWVGAIYALSNYDGKTFDPIVRTDSRAKKYLNDVNLITDKGGLPPEPISGLSIENKDTIWVGTRESILKYNPQNKSVQAFSPWSNIKSPNKSGIELSIIGARELKQDGSDIWIGSILRGLIKFDKVTKSAKVFEGDVGNNINLTKVTGITDLDSNNLLLATSDGLIKFDKATEAFSRFPSLSPVTKPVTSVSKSSDGSIWVGGLNVYHIRNGSEYTIYDHQKDFNISRKDTTASYIYLDEQGTIFVFYDDKGIYRASSHSSKVRMLNQVAGAGDDVKVLRHVSNNDFYVGYSKGLVKASYSADRMTYKAIKRKDGTNFEGVRDIHIGRGGKAVVADRNSISIIEESIVTQRLEIPAELIKDKYIHSVVEDYNGNIWFSIRRNGVFRISPRTGKIERTSEFIDQKLSLWMHIKLFLNHSRDKIIYFKSSDGFGEYDIKSGEMVRVFKEREKKKPFEKELPFKESSVWNQIRTQDKKHLWATHAERYVSYFDLSDNTGGTLEIPIKEPIFGIGESSFADSFWLTGEHGTITLWNKKSNSVVSFDDLDGLPVHGVSGSMLSLENGTVLFGSREGLALISPQSMKAPRSTISTRITSVSVNHKEEQPPSALTLELEHYQNVLEFSFHSTYSAQPNRVQHRYRLKGIYDSWRELEAGLRKVKYTNLDPGNYTFEVSSSIDGKWDSPVSKLEFNISPSVWVSLPALFTYTLLALISLYLAYFFKTRADKQRNKYLETLVGEQTNEINEMLDFSNNFILQVTHEFKTMLQSQVSTLETMEDNATTEQASNIKLLEQANWKMSRNVNQLLDLTKLKSKPKLELVKIDIVEMLRQISQQFIPISSQSNVSLSFQLPEKSIYVNAEHDSLESIFTNLVFNAIKYSKNNGTVEVLIEEHQSAVTVEVKDQGFGINHTNLPDSFIYEGSGPEALVRTENKALFSNGVGLGVVEEAAKKNNATVRVKSTLNEGCSFEVELNTKQNTNKIFPVSVHPINVRSRPTHLENDLASICDLLTFEKGRELILLVDDDLSILKGFSVQINKQFNVILAKSGEQGISMAIEHCPDLIVTDLSMPGKDGFEVIEFIKNNKNLSHIPVLLFTAVANKNIQVKGLKIGADDVIAKPVKSEVMLQKIRNRLDINKLIWKQINCKIDSGISVAYDKTSEPPSSSEIEQRDTAEWIAKLNAYIDGNMTNKKKLQQKEIASFMGVRERFLSRKIAAITETDSARNYITRYRLLKARTNILSEDFVAVQVTAVEHGFTAASFSTEFKKFFGITPSQLINSKNQ